MRIKARHPLVMLVAVAQHYIWAVLLWVDGGVATVTATSGLHGVFEDHLPLLLVFVATLAFIALCLERDTLLPIVLLLPQQAILIACAGSAVTAMITGQFADGVLRPVAFIIADQCLAVLLMMFHTVAVYLNVKDRDG